jgi:glutamyl-tRNA reductase
VNLACVGCNWKTPVRIRERLAFAPNVVAAVLSRVRGTHRDAETVLLSTCNRTELYVGWESDASALEVDSLPALLAQERGFGLSELLPYLYRMTNAQAAAHLFQVAAGLDSLVLGEVQILGQAREAYRLADAAGAVGATLHPLFQRAFAAAKRVQNETALAKGRLSIAGAAVEFVEGVFETLRDKTVLVVGAGKMAELAVTHLKERAPKRLVVVNRTLERARELAERMGGTARPMAELSAALVDADVVVSSTGADEPVVRASAFAEVHRGRRGRPLAVVDIAVPRDFDPAVGDFDNVFLWNIDHLESVRTQTLRSREKALDDAYRIVEEELAAYERTLRDRRAGPILRQLEGVFDEAIEKEIEALNGAGDREQYRQFAHRLKNKLLHGPRSALKREADDHQTLLEALGKLFRLTK